MLHVRKCQLYHQILLGHMVMSKSRNRSLFMNDREPAAGQGQLSE